MESSTTSATRGIEFSGEICGQALLLAVTIARGQPVHNRKGICGSYLCHCGVPDGVTKIRTYKVFIFREVREGTQDSFCNLVSSMAMSLNSLDSNTSRHSRHSTYSESSSRATICTRGCLQGGLFARDSSLLALWALVSGVRVGGMGVIGPEY